MLAETFFWIDFCFKKVVSRAGYYVVYHPFPEAAFFRFSILQLNNLCHMLGFIFKKIASLLAKKNIYLVKSLEYRQQPQPLQPSADYARYATLGLCYEEIVSNKVAGQLAEVGVYRGDFAKRLNQLFPDRKLYLFDTFKGFPEQDIKQEQQKGFSSGEQNFADTSVGLVRSKMTNPDRCIFKQGIFPQTALGVEEKFCLVSLDADLYTPIYEGLKFFYPRLEKGGYIFVHDFNNVLYKGAREAVTQYCKEQAINYVPIPDSGGTAIITR